MQVYDCFCDNPDLPDLDIEQIRKLGIELSELLSNISTDFMITSVWSIRKRGVKKIRKKYLSGF